MSMIEISADKLNSFIINFKREWNKRLRHKDLDQVELNNLQKLFKTIKCFERILLHFKETKISLFNSLKENNKINFKTTFYRYLEKYHKWTIENDLSIFFLKSTRPKNIKYVFNQQIRHKISNLYFNDYHNCLVVYFMLKTRFKLKISLNTVSKIIKSDERYQIRKNKIKLKHNLRSYDLDFGNIQMDLKIFGPKQSPTGNRIVVFDAKDEQSKIVYLEVIKDMTMTNLLQATKNMIKYFQTKIGMQIKRVRTDNAMCFKENNFVKSYAYSSLLKSCGIKQEFIPLKQPECNGVIERHHRTLDNEFLVKIRSHFSFDMIKKEATKFMKFHNFSRPHFYSFLNKSKFKSFDSKIFIPFEFYKRTII